MDWVHSTTKWFSVHTLVFNVEESYPAWIRTLSTQWYGQITYRAVILFIVYALDTLALMVLFHFWMVNQMEIQIRGAPWPTAHYHLDPIWKVWLSFVSWFIWDCVSVSFILNLALLSVAGKIICSSSTQRISLWNMSVSRLGEVADLHCTWFSYFFFFNFNIMLTELNNLASLFVWFASRCL